MTPTPNARFWVYHPSGSWVKLTLRPGQRVELHSGQRTEEGYSCEAETFEHDGAGVAHSWCTWGMDCDGRHEDGGERYCPLAHLRSREPVLDGPDTVGVMLPEWAPGESWQRDHSAEAAGY